MSLGPVSYEDLLDRIRVLEKENELLAERAEEISLLGLLAEHLEAESDLDELLACVLERICILKAIPYGACLAGPGPELSILASYHLRRPEGALAADHFVRSGGPGLLACCGDGQRAGVGFEVLEIGAPGLAATSWAYVPVRNEPGQACGFLFVDDRRTMVELEPMLAVLARVADLVKAKLVNLTLIAELQTLTRDLDLLVAERTRALGLSEARYRILFEHVPDGILLVDADVEGTFGRIEDANAVAAALYGYSLEELRQMDIEALGAPGAGSRLESFEARVWRLREGETVREELTQRRKDGSTLPVEAIGTLVRVHEHAYVVVFFRDLTERKLADQLLLSAQRAESLGVLAGGIAHDFNNLLTAIIGQTGLAIDKQGLDGPGKENLDRALEAAERAAALTRQMLAYSGRGQVTVQSLPVNLIIRENLGLLEAGIPKQVHFELDLEPGLPTVVGDSSQFQQVIMNLVINGVQAIGEAPGRVVVRTRAMRLDRMDRAEWPLGHDSLTPGEYVRIEVEDSGCGLSEAIRSRIFEPFFSTKAQGHGLGLSAVQGIIRGHRGGLGVDSEPGAGTRFRILLPVGEDVPGVEPALPEAVGTGSRVVLVIDDENYMLDVVRDILEGAGHAALLASSGEEGLELLGQHRGAINLVLLDLSMPGMDGVETCQRIRQTDAGVPVVLTSGFAEEEAVLKLQGMDLAGFLQKPYRVGTLLALVEAIS